MYYRKWNFFWVYENNTMSFVFLMGWAFSKMWKFNVKFWSNISQRVAQWVKVFYSEFEGLVVQFWPGPWLGYETESCNKIPVNFLQSKDVSNLSVFNLMRKAIYFQIAQNGIRGSQLICKESKNNGNKLVFYDLSVLASSRLSYSINWSVG